MANTKSAMKQMRQSERRRLRNRSIRSRVRSAVKVARETAGATGRETAGATGRETAGATGRDTAAGTDVAQAVREAIRALDKAVTKGVIHRNTAARKKSALARRIAARG